MVLTIAVRFFMRVNSRACVTAWISCAVICGAARGTLTAFAQAARANVTITMLEVKRI